MASVLLNDFVLAFLNHEMRIIFSNCSESSSGLGIIWNLRVKILDSETWLLSGDRMPGNFNTIFWWIFTSIHLAFLFPILLHCQCICVFMECVCVCVGKVEAREDHSEPTSCRMTKYAKSKLLRPSSLLWTLTVAHLWSLTIEHFSGSYICTVFIHPFFLT